MGTVAVATASSDEIPAADVSSTSTEAGNVVDTQAPRGVYQSALEALALLSLMIVMIVETREDRGSLKSTRAAGRAETVFEPYSTRNIATGSMWSARKMGGIAATRPAPKITMAGITSMAGSLAFT